MTGAKSRGSAEACQASHRERMAASRVCLVSLVYLVHLVSFVQPDTLDRPNRPDRVNGQDRPAELLEFCYGFGEALCWGGGVSVDESVTVTCS
jgi:hypothetical protein